VEAEPLGELAGDRALTRAGGASIATIIVYHESTARRSREADGDGLRVLDADAAPESTPATAPSIAMRWSPWACMRPPSSRVGTPRTTKPSGAAVMWARARRSASTVVSMRSVSLARSSSRRARPTRRGHRGDEREERQLVDEVRHLLRADLCRGQLGGAHLEVGDRLAALVAPGCRR